jgi:hypothetical protein
VKGEWTASGGAFHRAYLRATQQAFLEPHELAFRYFGGVFRRLRYNNLKAAEEDPARLIIEIGNESYRFRRTLEKRKKKG